MKVWALLLLVASPLAVAQMALAQSYQAVHEPVLGAVMDVTLIGIPAPQAQGLVQKIVADIDRLERVLSVEREGSDIRKLNDQGYSAPVAPVLYRTLSGCEHWRQVTEGAFSCRLGELSGVWQRAAADNRVPDRSALRQAARRISASDWQVSLSQAQIPAGQLAVDTIVRSVMLDELLSRILQEAPHLKGIKLVIAGDGVYWGKNLEGQDWPVTFDRAGTDTVETLVLSGKAMAVREHNHNYWDIDRRRFSHILNPDDGWALTFAPSAVVVAPSAEAAAALATALTVLPIRRGLALINQLPEVEALIITESGKPFASEGWYSLLIPDTGHPSLWELDRQFLVEYQIPAHPVAEYRRPYVAVWITDEQQALVRQLLVHGENLRWLREVPLWWRRHGRRDESMIDGFARPTPVPGQHMLVWDGRDDQGRKVQAGAYILHIEAVREHGDRELISLPFDLSGRSFELQKQGSRELGRVRVTFSPASE